MTRRIPRTTPSHQIRGRCWDHPKRGMIWGYSLAAKARIFPDALTSATRALPVPTSIASSRSLVMECGDGESKRKYLRLAIQYADERRSQERDLNHDAWRTKNLGRDDLLYHSINKCLILDLS